MCTCTYSKSESQVYHKMKFCQELHQFILNSQEVNTIEINTNLRRFSNMLTRCKKHKIHCQSKYRQPWISCWTVIFSPHKAHISQAGIGSTSSILGVGLIIIRYRQAWTIICFSIHIHKTKATAFIFDAQFTCAREEIRKASNNYLKYKKTKVQMKNRLLLISKYN